VAPDTIAADTVWQAGQIYVVKTSITIKSSATLTIPSGTIVKFDNSSSLQVDGGLVIRGDVTDPVVFTTIQDDSVGGDTNGDGPPPSPYSPFVDVFMARPTQSNIDAQHFILKGAIYGGCGTLSIEDSEISNSLTVVSWDWLSGKYCGDAPTNIRIVRSKFDSVSTSKDNSTIKIDVPNDGIIDIEGNTIVGGVDIWGIVDLFGESITAGKLKFINNTILNNPAVYDWANSVNIGQRTQNYFTAAALPLEISNNVLKGTPGNILWIDGVIDTSHVFGNSVDDKNGRIYLSGSINTEFTISASGTTVVLRDIHVQSNGTLSVLAGARVGVGFLAVVGTLNVTGTDILPVYFDPEGMVSASSSNFSIDISGSGKATFQHAVFTKLNNITTRGDLEITKSEFVDPMGGADNYWVDNNRWPQNPLYDPTSESPTGYLIKQIRGNSYIDATFYNASHVLTVLEGSSILRGKLVAPTPDLSLVRTCDWQSSLCSVDARGFDWGTPEGPFVSGTRSDGSGTPKPALACGVVIVQPWVGMAGVNGRSVWDIGNCLGSSYDPAADINRSRTAYNEALSPYENACSTPGPGLEDACAVVAAQERCLAGAKQIVQSQTTFPIITDGNSAGEFAAQNAADFISKYSTPVQTVAGASSFGFAILGALRSIQAVSSAYDSCHP
jgi:hypothetical protein